MKKLLLLAMTMVMVGCGKKEPELSTEKVITPNEAANKLFVEAVELVSQAQTEEKHDVPAAIERYEQALAKVGNITSMYKESDIAVKLVSGATVFTGKSMAQIEDRVHGLKVSLITKTVRTVKDITIAENFQQAKITETFVESLPEVEGTGEGNLMVAMMKNTKTFKRTEKLTILWDKVSLDTTVTEIKVPATFRYHLRLSDPWKLEVHGQQCVVIAPRLRASLPVAIHTDRMQKKSDEGWARWNADEQMTALERSLTPRLNGYAQQENHIRQVRETARGTVANFVKEWLLKEDHWRTNRFRSIRVIFADEAEAKDFPTKPTLELN